MGVGGDVFSHLETEGDNFSYCEVYAAGTGLSLSTLNTHSVFLGTKAPCSQ